MNGTNPWKYENNRQHLKVEYGWNHAQGYYIIMKDVLITTRAPSGDQEPNVCFQAYTVGQGAGERMSLQAMANLWNVMQCRRVARMDIDANHSGQLLASVLAGQAAEHRR